MGRKRGAFGWISREVIGEFITQTIWPYLWPVVVGGLAMIAGYLENMPVAWLLFAATGATTFTASALLRTSEFRERITPKYKLKFAGLHIAKVVNQKHADKGVGIKIGVVLDNIASFPIEYQIDEMDVRLKDRVPQDAKRHNFGALVEPHSPTRYSEPMILLDEINVNESIQGSLRTKILYGKPGKLKFSIEKQYRLFVSQKENGSLAMEFFSEEVKHGTG